MTKRRDKKNYLAGHQRSWIWGRHAVGEILEAGQWPMHELYLADDLTEDAIATMEKQAQALGATTEVVSRKRIRALCGTSAHQGILARMGPYPYAPWDKATEDHGAPALWLVLDGLRDPNNFGALIRSAAALSATGIIVGQQEQTPVNNHVARASAGAVNRIPIIQAASLEEALATLQQQGVHCAAADPQGSVPVWECDFTRDIALVMGNESAGIREALLRLCDDRVVIPGNTLLDSLNVAAAGTVMLYEAARQRNAGTAG